MTTPNKNVPLFLYTINEVKKNTGNLLYKTRRFDVSDSAADSSVCFINKTLNFSGDDEEGRRVTQGITEISCFFFLYNRRADKKIIKGKSNVTNV